MKSCRAIISSVKSAAVVLCPIVLPLNHRRNTLGTIPQDVQLLSERPKMPESIKLGWSSYLSSQGPISDIDIVDMASKSTLVRGLKRRGPSSALDKAT